MLGSGKRFTKDFNSSTTIDASSFMERRNKSNHCSLLPEVKNSKESQSNAVADIDYSFRALQENHYEL